MKKIGFVHALILYLLTVDKVATEMERSRGSENIEIFHICVFIFAFMSCVSILVAYSFISSWSYKMFLRFIYRHKVITPIELVIPESKDDPTLEKLTWVHNECRTRPFLILTVPTSSSSDEHLTLAFLHKSDLLAYKMMWPHDC